MCKDMFIEPAIELSRGLHFFFNSREPCPAQELEKNLKAVRMALVKNLEPGVTVSLSLLEMLEADQVINESNYTLLSDLLCQAVLDVGRADISSDFCNSPVSGLK